MNALETTAFGVLWVMLLGLALLVLVLYRQVEKAYRQGTSEVAGEALAAGTAAPDLEVIRDGEMTNLDLPDEGLILLAFVSDGCEACAAFISDLNGDNFPAVKTMLLATGANLPELDRVDESRVAIRTVVSPADVKESYRVSAVPMLYLVRDTVIIGASHDGSPDGVRALLASGDTGTEHQDPEIVAVPGGGSGG